MIRGVVKNGVICPLEPMPWSEGREVIVEATEQTPPDTIAADDHWLEDMDRLTAELDDPEFWAEFDSRLAEADRLAKEIVRRQMELP